MKNIISIISLIICTSVFSQNEINGIGRFKIGMDISIIDSLKNEKYSYKIFDPIKDDYNTHSEASILNKLNRKKNIKKQNADKIIFEKQLSTNVSDYGSFPFIENNKKFIIKYYDVANIDIDYLELSFYNNKLYKINFTDNLELKLALETKYKSVKSEKLGKKATCVNSYREVEYQEIQLKNTYRNDDYINAYSTVDTFYYNCKELTVSLTSINDKKITDEVFNLEKAIVLNKYNNPNREELKALKKL